jgi:hypothetical protein
MLNHFQDVVNDFAIIVPPKILIYNNDYPEKRAFKNNRIALNRNYALSKCALKSERD